MAILRRTPRYLRAFVACFLSACAWATFPPAFAGQPAAGPQSFPAAARRAIAHGKPAEAEALARQRPANDPAAAAVLGQLAVIRGNHAEAQALLEPAAAREPTG